MRYSDHYDGCGGKNPKGPGATPEEIQKVIETEVAYLIDEEAKMSNEFTEAPASWNTKYLRDDGFVCQLTLRAATGADLLPRTDKAIEWLKSRNCQPMNGYEVNSGGNGKAKGNGNGGQSKTRICPLHHVEMRRREKQGDVWYSHKAMDPDTGQEYWCRGKAK